MRRVLIVTPPEPVVSVAEAKAHLRIDDDDQDALIEGLIAGATGHIDGPDGWLGRAVGVQTLEAGLDSFCHDRISLPYPPVIDVQSITYEDVAGAWQTLDPSVYDVRDGVIGSSWGKSWPGTRRYRGSSRSVLVRYTAGYQMPPPAIRVAILIMVADLYRNAGEAGGAVTASKVAMAPTVEALLAPFRVFA